ncbi:MAG: ribonuclease H-like domain-containing protein [Deltaproteobacteria bacterium]|nr:ribonuclease H-like domain-containing protein [Deltaproteobacteria bacterium]
MSTLLGKLRRREAVFAANGLADAIVTAPPRVDVPAPSWGDASGSLSLVTDVGALGATHLSVEVASLDECVGQVRLGSALDADMRLVSRLALDTSFETLAGDGALYLDTETSGLGGAAANRAFLVGLAYYDPSRRGFVVEQLLLRDLDDEPAMLEHVRRRIEAARFLVSYNGKSFDLPLLAARSVLARVGPWPSRPHLDLLHVARRVHDRKRFRMSLGVVERRVLAHERGPDISGEEVALRYAGYLFSGDEGPLGEVLVHNRHDVRSLIALLAHYGREVDALEGERPTNTSDLSRIARVMKRAGDLEWAKAFADRAVERAVSSEEAERHRVVLLSTTAEDDASEALRTRAAIARSRGDRRGSVADLEALLARAEDPDARLALAKHYEHHLRDPARALEQVERGTSEVPADSALRRARLLRKLRRSQR